MSLLIKLRQLSKTYIIDKQEFQALKELDLEIEQGELLAIIGASGSGKSTLMNILGCLDRPTSGKYYLNEQDVASFSANKLAYIRNHNIGFIFQSFFLLPRLTALQNVILPLFYRGTPKNVAIELAKDILNKLAVGHLLQNKPSQLSGGQQQRVAIARALIGNPDMILADEPTGALDSKTSGEIMALLAELNQQEKKTIIIITHDPLIASHCQRVISISDGQLKNQEIL